MVRIVTDSSVLYTVEQAQKAGFDAVPLCVSIGDMDGRDLQVDMKEFYAKIASGLHPTSSQPPIGDVVEVFEKYEGDEIINISMAEGLSGTYESACMAKTMIDDNERITVINTKTLCGPHRYIVEKAQEMKEAGATAAEIVEWVNAASEKHESFLIPQDFDFLRRGGRLTPVAATIGSVLKLKPIMTQTPDGKRLDKFGVKRTMGAALKVVVDRMIEKEVGTNHKIYVVHAEAMKDALAAKKMIEEAIPGADIEIYELSPVFVTQGGPQCVAIQYIEK